MIDESAYIQCPMDNFSFRKAIECENCKNYQGVKEINKDPAKLWSDRFFIVCAYPMTRRTRMIVDEATMAMIVNDLKRRSQIESRAKE